MSHRHLQLADTTVTCAVAGLLALLAFRRKRKAIAQAAASHDAKPKEEWELLGFGSAIRKDFLIDFHSGYTHLNHGSYGAPPRPVVDAAIAEMYSIESFPDGEQVVSLFRPHNHPGSAVTLRCVFDNNLCALFSAWRVLQTSSGGVHCHGTFSFVMS